MHKTLPPTALAADFSSCFSEILLTSCRWAATMGFVLCSVASPPLRSQPMSILSCLDLR